MISGIFRVLPILPRAALNLVSCVVAEEEAAWSFYIICTKQMMQLERWSDVK